MITAIHKSMAAKREALEKDEKGFTLIELLVVVLIIGILAAIAIPAFLSQQATARDGAVKSDIANAKVALIALLVEDPTTFPAEGALTAVGTEFTADAASNLELSGDALDFCVEGYNTTNGSTALFSAADNGGVKEGGCP